MNTGKRDSREWIPGIVDEPTNEDMAILSRRALLLESKSRMLSIHLREISNNERYQHHKGMLKARQREIVSLRQILDMIDQDLQAALGEEVEHDGH